MIRVLLADDEELVRTGLRMILDAEPDITVVGDAVDGADAVARAEELAPDVVLMDIRMPRLDGLEATRRIGAMKAGPKVVILTTFDLDEHVYAALAAGASGFLLKDAPASQLVHAIKVATAGDALLAPSVTRRLIARFTDSHTAPATPAAGRPHRARDRGPRPHGRGALERRDRRAPRRRRCNREDACRTSPGQARRPRQGASGSDRPQVRDGQLTSDRWMFGVRGTRVREHTSRRVTVSPSTEVTVPSKATGALASSSTLNMMHIAIGSSPPAFNARGGLS